MFRGEATASRRNDALAAAEAEARRHAASMRGVEVSNRIVSRMATGENDYFLADGLQKVEVVLAGTKVIRSEVQLEGPDTFRALVEIQVPREQIYPHEVVDRILAGPEPERESSLRTFLRSIPAGDHDTRILVLRELAMLTRAQEDVLRLVAANEEAGWPEAALASLEYWISILPAPNQRLGKKRDQLVLQLPHPADQVGGLLRAARAQPTSDLRLSVNRETAKPTDVVRIHGRVRAGRRLTLYWVDGVSLSRLHSEVFQDGAVDKDIDYAGMHEGFIPGRVHVVAVSASPSILLPPLHEQIDLQACERGVLAQRATLRSTIQELVALVGLPGVETTTLSWEQVEASGS